MEQNEKEIVMTEEKTEATAEVVEPAACEATPSVENTQTSASETAEAQPAPVAETAAQPAEQPAEVKKETFEDVAAANQEDTETPLDKNVRLMSPGRMVLRRFFRSKLSVVGIIMLAALFLFCWLGPVVY